MPLHIASIDHFYWQKALLLCKLMMAFRHFICLHCIYI